MRPDDAGIGAAEREVVRDRDGDRHRPRLVGDVVQIAFGIALAVVRGRRRDLVRDRLDGDDVLDRARCAQQVTDHRLRAADGGVVRVLSEPDLRRRGLGRIVLRRAGAVTVDVRDLVRVDARCAQRSLDRAARALAFRVGSRRVVAVRREAVPEDLGEDRRAELAREILAQQDEHAASLPQRETVPVA